MFRKTKKSPTLFMNELSKDRVERGEKTYKFGFGESPFLPPQRVQEALQEAAHRKEYAPVQGMLILRENAARFHTMSDAIDTQPDQIMIGTGSKSLLLNSLLAFEDADVLLPAPSWVSYEPQSILAGHTVHRVPTTYDKRWRVEPDILDAQLSTLSGNKKSKLLILNYPGNPDGLSYSAEELEELSAVFRKHRVWLISDEIYGLLHHQDKHVTLRRFYPEQTIVTTGLSKWCGAGGWRLGVQILPPDAPQELHDALIGITSETFSCVATPIQIAATQAYVRDEETKRYLRQQRNILRVIGTKVHHDLAAAGIAVHPPEGGFYLFLDFSPLRDALHTRGMTTDSDICEKLLKETGVALLPGVAFGMSAEALTARLSYVDFKGSALINDIENKGNVPAAVEANCQHMFEGIEQLANWVQKTQP